MKYKLEYRYLNGNYLDWGDKCFNTLDELKSFIRKTCFTESCNSWSGKIFRSEHEYDKVFQIVETPLDNSFIEDIIKEETEKAEKYNEEFEAKKLQISKEKEKAEYERLKKLYGG